MKRDNVAKVLRSQIFMEIFKATEMDENPQNSSDQCCVSNILYKIFVNVEKLFLWKSNYWKHKEALIINNIIYKYLLLEKSPLSLSDPLKFTPIPVTATLKKPPSKSHEHQRDFYLEFSFFPS